jgi:hypothetical protein
MLYQAHLAWAGFELATLVVIGTDYIGSYKSNYHIWYDHDNGSPTMWFEKRRFSNQYLLKTIVNITNFTKKLQLYLTTH